MVENKKNVVMVSSTNFYVLKEKPNLISYKEVIGDEREKWKNIKLKIDIDSKLPNENEILYVYGDLWKLIISNDDIIV